MDALGDDVIQLIGLFTDRRELLYTFASINRQFYEAVERLFPIMCELDFKMNMSKVSDPKKAFISYYKAKVLVLYTSFYFDIEKLRQAFYDHFFPYNDNPMKQLPDRFLAVDASYPNVLPLHKFSLIITCGGNSFKDAHKLGTDMAQYITKYRGRVITALWCNVNNRRACKFLGLYNYDVLNPIQQGKDIKETTWHMKDPGIPEFTQWIQPALPTEKLSTENIVSDGKLNPEHGRALALFSSHIAVAESTLYKMLHFNFRLYEFMLPLLLRGMEYLLQK